MNIIAKTRKLRMNYANSKEHVPRAERNNRKIEERVRSSYHQLPYDQLPKLLVEAMVMEGAKKLNLFPARHGVSKYYSPRMILHKENISFKHHGTYTLG